MKFSEAMQIKCSLMGVKYYDDFPYSESFFIKDDEILDDNGKARFDEYVISVQDEPGYDYSPVTNYTIKADKMEKYMHHYMQATK